mmetsp:Transcript_10573/g.30532  ORF Transcript_10573/g.30532 Transcript_10573/m.30532 type:complete len:217 (-) Transcript_10573:567-1217(-)
MSARAASMLLAPPCPTCSLCFTTSAGVLTSTDGSDASALARKYTAVVLGTPLASNGCSRSNAPKNTADAGVATKIAGSRPSKSRRERSRSMALSAWASAAACLLLTVACFRSPSSVASYGSSASRSPGRRTMRCGANSRSPPLLPTDDDSARWPTGVLSAFAPPHLVPDRTGVVPKALAALSLPLISGGPEGSCSSAVEVRLRRLTCCRVLMVSRG